MELEVLTLFLCFLSVAEVSEDFTTGRSAFTTVWDNIVRKDTIGVYPVSACVVSATDTSMHT